jgi:hypothetical protein
LSYSLSDIKIAAYKWEELPNMGHNERLLWMGLGYCYEWYRSHPEDKADCDDLSQRYIKAFYGKDDLS